MTLQNMRLIILLPIVCLLIACQTSQPDRLSDELSFDGLKQVHAPKVSEAWIHPDFEPRDYDQITFRSVGIQYAPTRKSSSRHSSRGTGFPISDQQKSTLANIVEEEFRESLSQISDYKIVGEPQDRTLILLVSIIDVESHVPTDVFGLHEIYLSDVGKATLVLEFLDADTGATLVRVVDKREAKAPGSRLEISNPVTNWRAVRTLASQWARGLRIGIDQMKSSTGKIR